MATLLEPPALLSLGITVAAAAGAVWYSVRRSGTLAGPAPHVAAEDEEEWGVESPLPPAKRPYVYPADRPEPVIDFESETQGASVATAERVEAEPLASGSAGVSAAENLAPAQSGATVPLRHTTRVRLMPVDDLDDEYVPAPVHPQAPVAQPSEPLAAAPGDMPVGDQRDETTGRAHTASNSAAAESDDDDEEEELSLADLFARRRRQGPGRS